MAIATFYELADIIEADGWEALDAWDDSACDMLDGTETIRAFQHPDLADITLVLVDVDHPGSWAMIWNEEDGLFEAKIDLDNFDDEFDYVEFEDLIRDIFLVY